MDSLIQKLCALAEEANLEGLPGAAETILLIGSLVSLRPETASEAAAELSGHAEDSYRRETGCGQGTNAARMYALRASFFKRAAKLCAEASAPVETAGPTAAGGAS